MVQRIILRLKTDGREVVHMPEGFELENGVGRYFVSAREKDGWVTVETVLSFETSMIQPEAWSQLRALLLEAADPIHRTLLLE